MDQMDSVTQVTAHYYTKKNKVLVAIDGLTFRMRLNSKCETQPSTEPRGSIGEIRFCLRFLHGTNDLRINNLRRLQLQSFQGGGVPAAR